MTDGTGAEPDTGEPGQGPARGGRGGSGLWLRAMLAILGGGTVAAIIILSRHTLMLSLSELGSLDFRWFGLGLLCELVSLTAFGLSRRRLLRADGHDTSFRSVMAITYAGNALSMSIPFAGTELAAVFSYRQFRRRGLDPALTGWALGLSAIASSLALALVLVAGAVLGGAPLAQAAGFAGAAVFALPGITVLLALRYPRARKAANATVTKAVHLAQRLARKPVTDPAALEVFITRLATIRLSRPQYAEVFGLAVINWLADCACLACAIKATGSDIPWHGLILAYGAGAAAGSTGVTPGGFGLVEVALTPALVASGLGAAHALTAVLAYRLLNFWMILAGGWVALALLTRGRGHQPITRNGTSASASAHPAASPAADDRPAH